MRKFSNILKAGLVAAAFFAPLTGIANSASADTGYTLRVPIDTVISKVEVGSKHVLASEVVQSKYVGLSCSVNATAENQGSVHPDNDLVVSSGSSSVTLKDVERAGGVLTHAQGSLTLGSDVKVTLVMGKDKVFSGGMDVNVTCKEREIEVCRDGVITPIKETERRESDTDAPCPVDEKHINVCRNGSVVEIKESEKQSTDGSAPCPEVKGVGATTEQLPNTGAGSIAGIVGATFAGSTAIAQVRLRRKAAKRS